MRTRWLGLALVCALALPCPAAFPQTIKTSAANDSARKQVVKQGRDAYYNLRALGLDEFQSTVKPNWEQVLQGQGDPAQLQAAINLLNGIHFTMLLDHQGKVTVTHKTDVEPPNEQVRKGFEDIYSGIDQAVSGFFATWSLFMLNSPFPEVEGDYRLEDIGDRYRLSYKEGSSDIVTILGRDLLIQEVKVTSAGFVSVVKPRFATTGKGLVLNGYTGDYTPASGPGKVHLDVKIEHQPLQGLQLPISLIADTTLDGASTHMELAFLDFSVKSH